MPIRRLLGRGGDDAVEVRKQIMAVARPDRLLTLLTEPHRAVELGDGRWFFAALIQDGSGQAIAWTRWHPADSADVCECRFDGDLDELRTELVSVAMITEWRPVAGGDDDLLVLVGAEASKALAVDRAELIATAAVDGVRIRVLEVPGDASNNGWQTVRHQVLEARRPVVVVAYSGEAGSWRLREAVLAQGNRRLTDVVADDHTAGLLSAVLAGISLLRQPPVVPLQRNPLPVRRITREVVLTKTGDSRHFDVLEETGRRCSHGKTFKVGGSAPKKHAGVLRYMEKHHAGAVLVGAKACKGSGCHLVWVEFQADSESVGDAPAVDDPRAPPT